MYNIIKIKESIDCDNLNYRCRKREKDFSRNRKLTPKDLILYTLNNRGKTTKMELYDFIQEYIGSQLEWLCSEKNCSKHLQAGMKTNLFHIKTHKKR